MIRIENLETALALVKLRKTNLEILNNFEKSNHNQRISIRLEEMTISVRPAEVMNLLTMRVVENTQQLTALGVEC